MGDVKLFDVTVDDSLSIHSLTRLIEYSYQSITVIAGYSHNTADNLTAVDNLTGHSQSSLERLANRSQHSLQKIINDSHHSLTGMGIHKREKGDVSVAQSRTSLSSHSQPPIPPLPPFLVIGVLFSLSKNIPFYFSSPIKDFIKHNDSIGIVNCYSPWVPHSLHLQESLPTNKSISAILSKLKSAHRLPFFDLLG